MPKGTETKHEQMDGIEGSIALWKQSLTVVALILMATAAGFFWIYLPATGQKPETSPIGNWGAFGDFVGGLMNPLVAFAAFYWLTQSVKIQKIELQETRAELSAAAKAQEASAKANALLLKVQILQALIDHEKGQIALMDADLKEEIDGYLQQGADYKEAQRMAFKDIDVSNVIRRAHSKAIKDYLTEIKTILNEMT